MTNKQANKAASVSKSNTTGTGDGPEQAVPPSEITADTTAPTSTATDAKTPAPLDIDVLQKGDAPKLSPGSTETISYVVGWDVEPEQLVIQITGNSGGGLYSKKPIPLEAVMELLDSVKENQPFSSTMFKALWNNKGSNNNAGFLAAILRHLELIKAADTGRFAHQLTGKHPEWFERLDTTPTPEPAKPDTP